MLLAGGSAIDGSDPTLFMGLFDFSAADPITRSNWDVGSDIILKADKKKTIL